MQSVLPRRKVKLFGFTLGLLCCLAGCRSALDIPSGFTRIEGGTFELGQSGHHVNPSHTVQISPFLISLTEVSNQEFTDFVAATGYVTTAERRKDAKVFYPGLGEFKWVDDSTANWRYPNGISRGGIADKMDHPVTGISFVDVQAYCEWAGVRLPTLDEWELAAGRSGDSWFFWADNEMDRIGDYANVWSGPDHLEADSGDAFLYTAPIGSFDANPQGLLDIYGNVFEFCADRPERMADYDDVACARGGSWWCSTASCAYFNSVDIGRVKVWASFSNQGFRVVKDLPLRKDR